jgi:glycosyltransferase involved in cell wall biosynthesis
MGRRLRIAYFSPLPPARTGIADYSRELLPHLARLTEVTLFVDKSAVVDEATAVELPVYPTDVYARMRWEFDIALYQMGNSSFHGAMYDVLRRYPGVTVLHDYGLHHFISDQTIAHNRFAAYVREMGYALGPAGIELACQVRAGQRQLPFFEATLNDRLLHLSLGVLVHSDYVRQQLLAQKVPCPVGIVAAPIASYPAVSQRAQLGWPEDAVIFGSFGQVWREKQIEAALRAFARVRDVAPQARYLIVGDWAMGAGDLPALIAESGLADVVHCTGQVPDLADFVSWIATADVVVNLRAPTVGETSATALRALVAGRPLIIYDHGWYAELPDEICQKVAPLDDEALLAAMLKLATDVEVRGAMGQRGREYATQVHAPERAAQTYVDFIKRILADLSPRLTDVPS